MNMTERGRTFFWMGILTLFVFLCLCPLFFFYDIKGYSYPLGWLLGSLFSFFSYWSMDYQSRAMGKTDKKSSLAPVLIFMSLRFLGYAAVLIVSGICSFRPAYFGGFDAFNFYAAAAGLLPLPFLLLVFAFTKKRHPSATKEGEGREIE